MGAHALPVPLPGERWNGEMHKWDPIRMELGKNVGYEFQLHKSVISTMLLAYHVSAHRAHLPLLKQPIASLCCVVLKTMPPPPYSSDWVGQCKQSTCLE